MSERSYTSRQELDQYAFRPVITLLAPLACIVVQVLLPKGLLAKVALDLPLLAVIYFAVARRSPIAGTLTGTLIGLFQDGLTNLPFGIYGIAKGIIGYIAANIGFAVDMDNTVNRMVANFAFSMAQAAMLYLIKRWVLADATARLLPIHELIGAAANTLVGIPLFFLLDRFRVRE
jgi:rod shape-determining protein MreD